MVRAVAVNLTAGLAQDPVAKKFPGDLTDIQFGYSPVIYFVDVPGGEDISGNHREFRFFPYSPHDFRELLPYIWYYSGGKSK